MTAKIFILGAINPSCSLDLPKKVCMTNFKFYLFSGLPTYRVMQSHLEAVAFQALCKERTPVLQGILVDNIFPMPEYHRWLCNHTYFI